MENPPFVLENNIIKGFKLPQLAITSRLNDALLENFKNNPNFIAQVGI